jgi:hypothetical protein
MFSIKSIRLALVSLPVLSLVLAIASSGILASSAKAADDSRLEGGWSCKTTYTPLHSLNPAVSEGRITFNPVTFGGFGSYPTDQGTLEVCTLQGPISTMIILRS